jgi:hypothetical protein
LNTSPCCSRFNPRNDIYQQIEFIEVVRTQAQSIYQ